MGETRLCRWCRATKPIAAFSRHVAYAGGYTFKCLACQRATDRRLDRWARYRPVETTKEEEMG